MATQDHIHLDTTVGGLENAPQAKWTTFLDRREVVNLFASFDRNPINGRPNVYTLLQSDGEPYRPIDLEYANKVQEENGYTARERLQQLLAMVGKVVYVVDHVHPDDGQDHTAYVRQMYFEKPSSPIKGTAPGLIYYTVQVSLLSME